MTEGTRKIDLFLYSRGGEINVPWSLVSMARQFLGDRPLGVLIPFRAHSGATLLAAAGQRLHRVPTARRLDGLRDIGLAAGLVDVKVCAIDATWSGL